MAAIGGILVLAGFVLFVLALVAMFKPLPKLRMGTRKAAAIGMALSVGSCIVGGAITPTDGADPSAPVQVAEAEADTPAEPAAPAKPSTTPIGEPVSARGVEVTVESVRLRQSVGSQYLSERASEGGVLVIVQTKIKNVSDRPIGAFSIPTIELMDPAGVTYSSDIGKTSTHQVATESDAKGWSDLNPGITVRDSRVFEVAADRFDPETWVITVGGKSRKVAAGPVS
ncbi:DUF4352 domain-containing protein [Phenylobacterium sp.]|uniref:DUF4352 domain-containing protein n=1 Tax=Phenylobacterium sp. TaxID=1871053 RepID=UPI002730B129|nr:DUF4352 domain-containing protein [Phenylobacterium sp.]MDP2214995.1 DUF4352 domain-containing protein [Phenylobacterium sp.]